jgi:hypothetical protein
MKLAQPPASADGFYSCGYARGGRSFFVARGSQSLRKTNTHYDLLDAFAEEGCPVCRLTIRAVDHFIDSINYEFVNDPGFRAEVEPAWGFCNVHAQRWLKQAHPLGTAMIYDAVLGRISDELTKLRPHHHNGFLAGMSSLLASHDGGADDSACANLRPDGQCPACRTRAEQERTAIDSLLEGLADRTFLQAYEASAGLCLPHLRFALCQATDERAFAVLRDQAVAQHERFRTQLHEIMRKHDYRFRDEPSGAERGSVQRAVQHIAGVPGIADR